MVLSTSSSSTTTIIALILIILLHENFAALDRHGHGDLPKSDVDLLEFPLNLEYLEAEFFSWGAFGLGLDAFAPNLTKGGPSPKANLSPLIKDYIIALSLHFKNSDT
ncbi:hypothetical protein ACS0TY_029225 [Phlomoides rotata]